MAPNNENEILMRIIARILPSSAVEWSRVAVGYKEDSDEMDERDRIDLKHHLYTHHTTMTHIISYYRTIISYDSSMNCMIS